MRTAIRILAVLTVLTAQPSLARPPLRTSWGDPDLTGTWTNLSLTKLERPDGVSTLELTDAEAAKLEARLTDQRLHPAGDAIGQRATEVWPDAHLAIIDGKTRSSWLTAPSDGKLPYTAEGRRRLTAVLQGDFDNPESRPAMERCLSGGAVSPPIIPPNYNANYLIAQTAHDVVVLAEMNTEARIIPIGRPHQAAALAGAMGDSIGRFEGDTLVVETTGFPSDAVLSPGGGLVSPRTRVVERFARVSATELRYSFTVEDPDLYSQPWSGEAPFRATSERMYEFACHEGNYSLEAILAGARQTELQAVSR
jgi:hypothetical protein